MDAGVHLRKQSMSNHCHATQNHLPKVVNCKGAKKLIGIFQVVKEKKLDLALQKRSHKHRASIALVHIMRMVALVPWTPALLRYIRLSVIKISFEIAPSFNRPISAVDLPVTQAVH